MKLLSRIHRNPEPHWVGDGFPVRTLFSYYELGRELDPFLLLDYAGPTAFEPARRPRGVDFHPHRGFETVSIIYEGDIAHRDTAGNSGRIGRGDVQWMTAAAGILHEEKHTEEFTRAGGTLHLVQLWVNLPAAEKMSAPRYQTLLDADIPSAALPGGGRARVIAGEVDAVRGPARTVTPMNVWDVRLPAGARAELPAPEGHTTALVVQSGTIRLDGGEEAREPDLVLFERAGRGLSVEATADAMLLVLTGQPLLEPIVGRGPFVMNTDEEIRQAYRDFANGRMGALG